MIPVQRTIVRQADEDRIVANVKLSSTPIQLENPDPGSMFASLRPVLASVRANSAWALKEVQAILTAEQWNQVPDRIKTPLGQRRGPGGPPRQTSETRGSVCLTSRYSIPS